VLAPGAAQCVIHRHRQTCAAPRLTAPPDLVGRRILRRRHVIDLEADRIEAAGIGI
jgi:hypothetical protein